MTRRGPELMSWGGGRYRLLRIEGRPAIERRSAAGQWREQVSNRATAAKMLAVFEDYVEAVGRRVAGLPVVTPERRLELVSGLASMVVLAMGDAERRRLLDLVVLVANGAGHEREAERVLAERLDLGGAA